MSKKEATRQRILHTALRLFSEKGYLGASTREIAEQAGVNHLTLFRHFGNKETLFRESVVEHLTDRDYYPRIEGMLTGELAHDLEVLICAFLEELLPYKVTVLILLSEARQDEEIGRLSAEIVGNLTGHLERYLDRARQNGLIPPGDYRRIAEMFYSLLYMKVIYQSVPTLRDGDDDGQALEAFIRNMVHLFTTGLMNPMSEAQEHQERDVAP